MAGPRAGPDWQGLQRGISGQVLLPGSEAYQRARPPFTAWFDDLEPQAVVRCAAPQDAAEVIAFARRHGLGTATRSGGHSFAGSSCTRGIVIDVTPMSSVFVADGVAQVGAGVRLGDLYQRLGAHDLTVPAGTCPSVGVGGLTLGGGHGILGRAWGLTLDHLLGAQVVLADGRVVVCDEHHHPDLFWALRGAGAGNFGVVTSFSFQPRPAPRMTNFHLAWSYAHAVAVVAAWQRWAPQGPEQLAADLALSVTGEPAADPAVEVYGAVLGSERDATQLLEELVARVGADPLNHACRQLSYRDTTRFQAERSGATTQPAPPPQAQAARGGCRFTKSEFFDRPLPSQAIAALLDNLAKRRRPGQDRSVEFAPWGGAYRRRSPRATAFAHREQLFVLEHLSSVGPGASGQDKRAAHQWVRRSWACMHPWGSGRVYPNFPDPELDNWGWAYYGENYPRLRQVKARYDPDAVFRFPQSLPVR
jgi:FAD/FMN-containing dehydrogenase